MSVQSSPDNALGKSKLPTVIAEKSKEELQQFVLDLLRKLKQRDKRIEELTALAGTGTENAGALAVKYQEEVNAVVEASKESARAFEQQLQQLREEAEKKDAGLLAVRRQLDETVEESALYQQQLISLKEALRNLAEEREEAFSRISEEKEKVANLSDALHEANTLLAEMRAKSNSSLSPDLGPRVAELESALTSAKDAAAKMEHELEEAREVAGQVDYARSKISGLEAELLEAKEAAGKLKAELEEARVTVDHMVEVGEEVTRLEAEVAEAKEAAGQVEYARSKIGGLEADLSEAQATVANLTAKLSEAMEVTELLAKAKQEIATLTEQLGAAQRRGQEAVGQVEEARGTVAELEAELERAKGSSAELEAAKADVARLAAELKQAKREVEELTLESGEGHVKGGKTTSEGGATDGEGGSRMDDSDDMGMRRLVLDRSLGVKGMLEVLEEALKQLEREGGMELSLASAAGHQSEGMVNAALQVQAVKQMVPKLLLVAAELEGDGDKAAAADDKEAVMSLAQQAADVMGAVGACASMQAQMEDTGKVFWQALQVYTAACQNEEIQRVLRETASLAASMAATSAETVSVGSSDSGENAAPSVQRSPAQMRRSETVKDRVAQLEAQLKAYQELMKSVDQERAERDGVQWKGRTFDAGAAEELQQELALAKSASSVAEKKTARLQNELNERNAKITRLQTMLQVAEREKELAQKQLSEVNTVLQATPVAAGANLTPVSPGLPQPYLQAPSPVPDNGAHARGQKLGNTTQVATDLVKQLECSLENVSQWRATARTVQQEMENLQEQIHTQLQSKSGEVSKLQQEVTSYSAEMQNLQQRLHESQNVAAAAARAHEETKAILQEHQKQSAELQNQVKQLQSELESEQASKLEQESVLAKQKLDLGNQAALHEQLRVNDAEIRGLQDKIGMLESQLADQASGITSLKQELAKAAQEKQSMVSADDLSAASAKQEALEAEVCKLTADLHAIQEAHKHLQGTSEASQLAVEVELKSKSDELSKYRTKVQQLQAQLEMATAEAANIAEAETNIQLLANELQEKTQEIERLVYELEETSQQLSIAQEQLSDRDMEVLNLQAELDAKARGIANLDSQLMQRNADKVALSKAAVESQAELQQVQDQLSKLEEQNALLEKQKLDLDAQLGDNAARVKELEDQMAQNASQIQSLQTRLEESASRIQDLEDQLAKNATQIQRLEKQLAQSTSRVQELEQKLAGDVSQVEGLQEDLHKNAGHMQDLEAQLAARVSEATELEQQLSSRGAQIKELKEQNLAQETKIQALEKQLQDKLAELSHLKQTGFQLAERVSEIEDLKSSLETSVAELQRALQQVEQQKAEISEQACQSAELAARLEQAVAELRDGQESLQKKDVQISQLEQDLAAKVSEITQLLGQREKQQAELESRLAEVASLKASLKEQISLLEAAQQQSGAQASEVQEKNLRAVELEALLKQTASELRKAQEDVAQHAADAEDQRSQIANLTAALEEKSSQLHQALQVSQESALRISDLEKDLSGKADEVKRQEEKIQQQATIISDLNTQLEGRSSGIEALQRQLSMLSQSADGDEAHSGQASSSTPTAEAAVDSSELQAAKAQATRFAKELADVKKRFLAAAKKKQADFQARIKELEEKASAAKGASVEMEVMKVQLNSADVQLRDANAQLAELDKQLDALKAEKAELAAAAAAAAKDCETQAALAAEYKGLVAAKEQQNSQLQSRMDVELKRQAAASELQLNAVEEKLRQQDVRCESLTVEIQNLEKKLQENTAILKEKEEGSSTVVAGLKAELEAALKEMEATRQAADDVKKGTDIEREKAAKALEESRKRLAKVQKEKHALELQLAEAKGRQEGEKEASRMEVSNALKKVEAAQLEVAQLEAELKDYKARATSLLKAKDHELQAARTRGAGGLSDEEVEALRSEVQRLHLQVASAAAAAAAAGEAEHAARAAAAAAQQQATAQLSSLTSSAKFAQEALKEVQQECEQWRRKCEELQARSNKQQSVVAVAETAEKLKSMQKETVEKLEKKLAALQTEYQGFRVTSEAMMEAKDGEVQQLLRKNATLHEELVAARQLLTTAAAPPPSSPLATNLPMSADLTTPFKTSFLSPEASIPNGWEGGHYSDRKGYSEANLLENLMGGSEAGSQHLPSEWGGNDEAASDIGESRLVQLAARQAERDEVVAGMQLKIRQLEAEVMELDKEVQLREEMEAALKEAVREAERASQRAQRAADGTDMEYLKNMVVRLLQTYDGDSLLPILSALLSFSPREVETCKQAIEGNKVVVPLPAAAAVVDSSITAGATIVNSLSGWTTWLGTGTPQK